MEQISLMKPKGEGEHDTGLLEYLSDIIGVSHYEDVLKNLSVECSNPFSCPSTAHAHTLSTDRHSTLRPDALAQSAVLEYHSISCRYRGWQMMHFAARISSR